MASSDGSGLFDGWPGWAKPVFLLAVMALWIGVPMIAAWATVKHSGSLGEVNYQPMMAVLIAMTTATIAGIFLFMTFRIDRGARLEARREAKREAQDGIDEVKEKAKQKIGEVEKKAKGEIGKVMEKSKTEIGEVREKAEREIRESSKKVMHEVEQFKRTVTEEVEADINNLKGEASTLKGAVAEVGKSVAEAKESIAKATEEAVKAATTAPAIQQQVERRITEDVLRKHVEALLMLDVNVQIVARYASDMAQKLDVKATERLIGLMNETIERLSRHVKEVRRSGSQSWLAKAKALLTRMGGFFGGNRRS